MNKGKLLVISGFSGSGKGTIVKKLLNESDDFALSISATTRTPRTNEKNGVEYYFVSHEEFEKMIENNELLEYAKYNNNYYGTPRKFVEEKLEAGKSVLLEIEYQGAFQIKKQFPDAILIFIVPPSAKILHQRLKDRGTETDEQIRNRLKVALIEGKAASEYDYIVVNDDLETSVQNIVKITKDVYNKSEDFTELIISIVKDIEEENYV